MFIKKLRILGYKRFINFDIEFNSSLNILVGANESGKSTILEAIDIVLNHNINQVNRASYQYLFNIDNIKFFLNNPIQDNLPKIIIEIEFECDFKETYSQYLYGTNNIDKDSKYGIKFELFYDDEIDHNFNFDNCKTIPW